MFDELDAVEAQAQADAAAARSSEELDALFRQYIGKSSLWKSLSEQVKGLEPDERPAAGKKLGLFRAAVTGAIDERREALAAEEEANAVNTIDLTVAPLGMPRGTSHLITQIQRELTDIFIGLGYTVAEGPEVEDDWHNFEALNFPPGHSARDMQDTMYVQRGNGKEVVMRTQTSNVQVRTMESQEPPVYVVAPGRVFRLEAADARHSPVFHQIEGLAVDEGLSIAHMFGTIQTFVNAYFGRDVKIRFQPSFFPFTEPSAEFAAACVFCEGSGCRVCSHTGWIEIGGCGMVDPNVFEAVGYDTEKYTGFAFGFGLERMAMLRYGIDNISSFFANDVRFLRQF